MKIFILIFALFFVAAVSIQCDDKVKICHKGKIIEVSVKALDAHLAHGDTLIIPGW